ncbi:MAG TPA: TonB-dependent receptor [Thermoanaerobaculia bacterium]|nr:TonB-dependent receptor [Thermoanaerobaculia bacterium]
MPLGRADSLPANRYRAVLILGLAMLASGVGSLFADQNPAYQGRPLAEVLQDLRARGLNLIFSSAVVTDELRVTIEPRSTHPRAILDEILAPLGLTAREGPADSILIVRGRVPVQGSAQAPEEPKESYPVFLEEIVVTPGKLSIVRQDQAPRRTVSNADAVLVPSFGGDVSRVIEGLPGVTAPGNSAAFGIRGSQTRDVSLVLDGLELYEPFHLQSFQSPFSLIDSELVDTIDVYAGGFTADFGDRHGGFVEMSTWVPQDPFQGRIQVGSLNSRFAYGAPTSTGSWSISGRAWYPEAFRRTMELGEDGLDPRFGDAYVKYIFQPSSRTLVSAHALAADDRLKFSEPDGNESVDYWNRNNHLWLRALRLWSPEISSETVLSVGRLDRSREGISDPEDEIITVSDQRTVDLLGLKHDATWELSDSHLLRAGFEARRLLAEYRYSNGEGDSVTSHRIDPAGTSVGLYLAHRASLSPDLAAELGVRWDRQTHTDDDQLSPRLNVVWRRGDRSELRLALGRFYQSQRIHELRIEDGDTRFFPAELSQQAELTYQQELAGGLRLRLDAYYRRLSRLHPRSENFFNPIELFPETEPDRLLLRPERARLRGAEILLRGHPDKPIHWWMSYAWSSAHDVIDGTDVPRSWDQTHAVKWLVGYRPGERWSFSLTGTAHTGWPTTPATAELTTRPDGSTEITRVLGPLNSDRFPGYARLDVKASRVFALRHGRLRLEVEIVNLTDRENVCCVDEFIFEPRPDGTVAVGRELDDWLGITPSTGVSWEF